jgi:hypothetical protein
MCSSLIKSCKTLPSVRIASVLLLTLLLSGWSTCSAFIGFTSCQGVSQIQMTSLTPDSIPGDSNLVLLTVHGSGFTPNSQIVWNGSGLQTKFKSSRQLQVTITHETFESFGGSTGDTVNISVQTQGSGSGSGPGNGCPANWNSETRALSIT